MSRQHFKFRFPRMSKIRENLSELKAALRWCKTITNKRFSAFLWRDFLINVFYNIGFCLFCFISGLYLYMLVVETFSGDNLRFRMYAFIGWGKNFSFLCIYKTFLLYWCIYEFAVWVFLWLSLVNASFVVPLKSNFLISKFNGEHFSVAHFWTL